MRKILLFLLSLSVFSTYGQALSESFDGTSVPTAGDWVLGSGTWKVFDNGIGPGQSWGATSSGTLVYSAPRSAFLGKEAVAAGSVAEDWLVTPQVLVPANGQLRFFTRTTLAGNYGSLYSVLVSTTSQTDPTTFTPTALDQWDEPQIEGQADGYTFSDYHQVVVDLSAYAGLNVYIAFMMENNNGDRWLVDNVFVDSQCVDIPDTSLSVSSVGDTSVDLNWGNPSGATEWIVEWGPAGFTPGTGTIVDPVTSNPYTLGGLTAATEYDFYVQANCGNDNMSAWTGPYTFTTALCPATQQCDFEFVMTDSFGDGWNGNTMTISQFGIDITTITLSGTGPTNGDGPETVTVPLCSGQPFTLHWNTGGSFATEVGISILDPNDPSTPLFTHSPGTNNQGTDLYTGVANCTPPTCPKPSNIVITGVNTCCGTITWSDNTSGATSPATQWEVIIQPAGSGYPAAGATPTATVYTTSYNFSGLSSDTDYEVYISAICDAASTPTDPSDWSGPVAFSTTKNYCGGDHFTDSGGTTANYSNSEDITWTICPDNPGDVIQVFFNSFNTEANWDGLYVFDGPSTASPQIASANGAGNVPGGVAGSFWGTTVPGPFISSDPSGCITFRFRSDGSVNRPGWDATVICSPAPDCAMPSNPQVVMTDDSSATLTWTENNTPPATGWQIVVQPVGTGYPTTGATIITATSNPFTVTGLNSNSQYEFYVAADCGATDGTSFWTGPVAFNTLFAGCNGAAPAGNDCPTAAPVCSLDGYCGNTSGTYTVNTWSQLTSAFCGSIENNSFLTFVATCPSIDLVVDVGNCTNGTGIQFMVFTAATCGSGPVTSLGCYFQMNPPSNTLNFSGLTVGQTYYLMIDGFAGAICDYSVTVTSVGCTTTDVNIVQEDQSMCVDETLTLDVEGGNGNYMWSPATGLNTTTGDQVVFTPPGPGTYTIQVETDETSSICATADEIVITVYDNIAPTFTNPSPICAGEPNVPLDTTSSNGITGEWQLNTSVVTEIDASTAGTFDYIFIPDATLHPCAPQITMQVEILGTCAFNVLASAVNIDNCETTDPVGEFFNVTGSATNEIGPSANVYTANDFGTYLLDSGNLKLNGGQVKTFKTATSNVCEVNMYYRVYQGAPSGTFIQIPFGTTPYDVCGGTSFPTGGPCNPGDEKWQNIGAAINLTDSGTFAAGDYEIQVYYEVIGDENDPAGCSDTIYLDNGGAYYTASFSLQVAPTFTSIDEQCMGSNGSITFSGFVSGDVYSVSYDDDTAPVAPANYQADFNGQITIIGLNAGTYENFDFVINGCTISEAGPITLLDITPSVTGVTTNSPICFGEDAVFTVTTNPGINVDYTIDGGATTNTVVADASGIATITVPMPAVGTVDLVLQNIHNATCTIAVTDVASIVVNPLPTATITVNEYTCVGDNAIFTVTGTPDATVNYSVDGGSATPVVLDASGVGTIPIATTTAGVIQVTLINVIDGTTSCPATLTDQASTTVIDVPEPTFTPTDPTCTVPGSIEVTAPLSNILNAPTDIFISEITDPISTSGAVNYIELYNGTGSAVDLSNYKLKLFVNGNPSPSCDITLSGTLVDNGVFVVKLGSAPDIPGVTHDFVFTGCGSSINNNERVAITDLSDVIIDTWGDGTGAAFTPVNNGYNYRRNETGTTLPSATYSDADWTIIDWVATGEDYSNVGIYSLYTAYYEFTLSDGTTSTTQTDYTFSNVDPGTYTLVAHDLIADCYSDPVTVTLTPQGFTDPVTTFSYTTPVCEDNANLVPDTSTSGFATGGTFTSTAGLNINATTGEIDVVNSTPGTYTVTYTVAPDSANCVNGGSSTFDVVITAATMATFPATSQCENMTGNVLPTASNEGFTGSWTFGGSSVTTIDTSATGTFTYDFTPDAGQCASAGTLTVTITAAPVATFNAISLCLGDSNNVFPATSLEGFTGSWTLGGAAVTTIDTNTSGMSTYVFTPDAGQCASEGSLEVMITDKTPITFADVEACGNATIEFPTRTEEDYTLSGTWSPSSINTSVAGTTEYTFTPDDVCYASGIFTVDIIGCEIPKGISPNGDGLNDFFDLSSFNVSKLEIFNRYGMKMYSKSNYIDEWDGKEDNGNELPDGTYFYVIKLKDLPAKTGWVYINRQH